MRNNPPIIRYLMFAGELAVKTRLASRRPIWPIEEYPSSLFALSCFRPIMFEKKKVTTPAIPNTVRKFPGSNGIIL